MTTPALKLEDGKIAMQVQLSSDEGAELLEALEPIMLAAGGGHLDAVVVLLDTAAAIAAAGGGTQGQFLEEVAKVVQAREERGRGFSRPAGVKPC